ncbi:CmpA/NrtA family ABC transporter substrate-binding protein [Paraburkholderia kururiensis]|uniref:CmpA/NrtA family ABC transporter substrate-binding protein n=1 Tax=Paraburkholderia kururiensis TaxID=984307 RepID=UPI0018F3763B|nr:CmpA/NrtA family ABC transporter substrate-binding protein [Paraburkholderia kururiensis]
MNKPSSLAADAKPRAAGAPEKTHLRLGYVALTDAAPLVAAKMLEFGHAYGLTLELCRQPSWAAVRDKLLCGELDAAHALYGLAYGVQLGIGGPQADMAVLMVLNRNGQAITLSNRLADALDEHRTLHDALATLGRKPVFAQTFPTGTHAMWLYYWLASERVHPLRDIESVVIPPPQMGDALTAGQLDGFCAGEPWNAAAQARHAGRTALFTSEIWPDHPEKVLAATREFVTRHPRTARALVQTMLDACRWLDDPGHRDDTAQWLAQPEFIGVPHELIAPRLAATLPDEVRDGVYGKRLPVRFFDGGNVNYPRASDGAWFLTQYRRWGLIDTVDYLAVAAAINQTALYREAAAAMEIAVPAHEAAPVLVDGRLWDDSDLDAYAEGFDIHV